MKKPRINRICSSANYEKTHKVIVMEKIKMERKLYVLCFGKMVEISKEEAEVLKRTIRIIEK